MLLKSIALVLWETVNTTPGRVGVNFPPDIVAAIKKELESDSVINLNLFSGAREYLFDIMAIRMIPPYRSELPLSNVEEQIEKIKVPLEKEKESKSKKTRLSMVLLSPRRTETNVKIVDSKSKKNNKNEELSWIEKQRREKELLEGYFYNPSEYFLNFFLY